MSLTITFAFSDDKASFRSEAIFLNVKIFVKSGVWQLQKLLLADIIIRHFKKIWKTL